jgi:hypothetical protein
MTDEICQSPRGIAPADAVPRARWPKWKIALAYAVMLTIAMLSIWLIDTHVMKVSADAARAEGF